MTLPNLKQVPVWIDHPQRPDWAYLDRAGGWVVQVWERATPGCDDTPWAGTLRVAVKHTSAKRRADYDARENTLPVTWDDLQSIKDQLWPGRIGLEVYPPHDKIVDVANMRWLWILPAGAILPFNLQQHDTFLASKKGA